MGNREWPGQPGEQSPRPRLLQGSGGAPCPTPASRTHAQRLGNRRPVVATRCFLGGAHVPPTSDDPAYSGVFKHRTATSKTQRGGRRRTAHRRQPCPAHLRPQRQEETLGLRHQTGPVAAEDIPVTARENSPTRGAGGHSTSRKLQPRPPVLPSKCPSLPGPAPRPPPGSHAAHPSLPVPRGLPRPRGHRLLLRRPPVLTYRPHLPPRHTASTTTCQELRPLSVCASAEGTLCPITALGQARRRRRRKRWSGRGEGTPPPAPRTSAPLRRSHPSPCGLPRAAWGLQATAAQDAHCNRILVTWAERKSPPRLASPHHSCGRTHTHGLGQGAHHQIPERVPHSSNPLLALSGPLCPGVPPTQTELKQHTHQAGLHPLDAPPSLSERRAPASEATSTGL